MKLDPYTIMAECVGHTIDEGGSLGTTDDLVFLELRHFHGHIHFIAQVSRDTQT